MARLRADTSNDSRAYTQVTTKVTLEGNFFRKDPKKTIRQNIRDMHDALSKELESKVRGDIESHASEMPGWTGWTRDHVRGYTTFDGKRWQLWSAVSAFTADLGAKDAIRTKAAAASIERRWHPFRRVKSAVYRSRAVISADLSKGLD